jgi:beta-galactosidase
MFVPGPWVKAGRNEFIVLDYWGDSDASLAGLDKPILDVLRPELDLFGRQAGVKRLRVAGDITHRGEFVPGGDSQPVEFPEPVRGRYFALEALDSQIGGRSASIADLSLLGADGQNLDSQLWTIAGMSSQELDFVVSKVLDFYE